MERKVARQSRSLRGFLLYNLSMKHLTDLDMIKESLHNEKKREKLKDSLLPLVDAIAERYLNYGSTKEELREISWTYFDFAMKKYVERVEKEPETKALYKFSTYFSWYIKTSIETYLGIAEEPIKNIQPKRLCA